MIMIQKPNFDIILLNDEGGLTPEITLRRELSELLAVMHGDGGHYEEKHTTVKAVIDAKALLHTKWVTNEHLADINNLAEDNKSLRLSYELHMKASSIALKEANETIERLKAMVKEAEEIGGYKF